jgi:hypothetical protein
MTTNFRAIRPSTSPISSSGWRRIRPKSMVAPTVMKNSPSSRPRNGSMSVSSSRRNSLSASTTPARKAPSAGDRPTICISRATPTTISREVAVKISRSRDWAMKRNTGRTTKRPPPTTAPTAASTARVCSQAGRSEIRLVAWVSATSFTGPVASSGSRANRGMIDRSCSSRTPNAARPTGPCRRPFSSRVCRTMAVELMASTSPAARAVGQGRPNSMLAPAMARAVAVTCAPPRPKMVLRIDHSRAGRTSRPIRNSRMTTPNSANFITSSGSPVRFRAKGPIRAPAIR